MQPERGTDALPELDSELAPFLELLADLIVDSSTLPAMREYLGSVSVSTATDRVEVSEQVVDADSGVLVRVLRPTSARELRPCVFSIHGGGYVLGNRTIDEDRLTAWVVELGCVTVSVEYRLAPEHPYPAPLDDCYAGLKWVHEHADELGIDPARTGISGVSAGGGLAAALALLARDRGELPVAFQLLDSPMLDDRQRTPSSMAEGLAVWSRESNRFGWQSYLGEQYGSDAVPAYAVPARATDLSGLPPALVLVGAVDGFRDEDVDYATRLCQAGVSTELHVYPGAPHGFSLFPDAAVSRQASADIRRWLSRMITR